MSGRNLIVIAALAALAACGGAPLRYYTLVKPAAPVAVGTAGRYAIEVLPVTVPAQVDQPQLVLRMSDGELALAENRQWLAPLGDEIRAALSAELTARLGVQDAYRVPQPGTLPVYRVRADVRRFESSLSRRASIEVLWTIERPQDQAAAISCASSFEEAVSSGYPALVTGHQRALATLADHMARTVQNVATNKGAPAACY